MSILSAHTGSLVPRSHNTSFCLGTTLEHAISASTTLSLLVHRMLCKQRTTISCTVPLSHFCFTTKLHIEALTAYRPSCDDPDYFIAGSLHENVLQAFKSYNNGLGHKSNLD